MWRGNTSQGLVTETPIESQRHARTVLAHAAAAVLQVSNAAPLKVALGVEGVVDGGMNRQKPLS